MIMVDKCLASAQINSEREVISMTYAEAFHKIKTKLSKADISTLKDNFAIQVTLKDEEAAGTFYVAFIDGEFSVEPYDYRDNNVAIDISTDDFIKIVSGRLNKDRALAGGRIDAFGDFDAVSYIAGIVKPQPRKTAAKKEPAKKTTKKVK